MDVKAATIRAYCASRGYPLPEPEWQFARPRRWRFDLAFVAQKVALELEGGLFGRGRPCALCGRRRVAGHSSVERTKTDMDKYNQASILGWRVLRATPEQVESGAVFGLLDEVFGRKS